MTNSETARSTYLVLGLGILAVSFAAILIRYAQAEAVPSLYIAAFRLGGAALLLTPVTLMRHRDDIRKLSRADWGLAAMSGVFLAAHFVFWTLSLEYTTVLLSVTLVTTTSIWTALLEWGVLRQPPRAMVLWGMLIAFAGGVVLGIPAEGTAAVSASNPLLGAVLALLGGVAVAIYMTIGRKLRAGLSLFPYIWIVYSIGALALLPILLLRDVPLVGYSAGGYGWLIALAVVPQLIGHSSLNYAVKYLSATYISVLTKLEPIVSAIIAYFVFLEVPTRPEVIGSVVILVGVIVASLRRRTRVTKPDSAEAATSA